MVLAAAGGVDHKHLVGLAEKYFGKTGTKYPSEIPSIKGCRFTGSQVCFMFLGICVCVSLKSCLFELF
jgi:hypothetical protein